MTDRWRRANLGDVCQFQGGTQPPQNTFVSRPQEGYVRLLQIRDFETDKHATYVSKKFNLRLADETDVLLARYGASVGKILTGKSGAINVALMKANPDEKSLVKKYLYYFLQTKRIQSYLKNLGGRSAQAGFNQGELNRITINLPSLREQECIGFVLCQITYARKMREKELELERERKAALMEHLFTRGTRGESLKETAIGNIPESWRVVKLGEILKFKSGESRPNDLSELPEGIKRVPVYGGNGIMGYTEKVFSQERLLIVGRVGAYCGCVHIADAPNWITDNALFSVEWFRKDVSLDFLAYYLHRSDLNRLQRRAGQPLVTQSILHEVEIGLPDVEEQKIITDVLVFCDKKLRSLEVELQLLNELFQAMLEELMTGRLSVENLVEEIVA